MFAAERQAREERAALIKNTEPLVQKLQNGVRLTVEERASLKQQHEAIAEKSQEIREYEQAREAAEAASADVPAPESRDVQASDVERRERDFSAYLRSGTVSPELRAAGEATNSAGGYLVPPGWWQRLQVAQKAFGGTANDFQPLETESGQPMQWATVDPTSIVGQLVGSQTSPPAAAASAGGTGNENAQIQDVDYAFGQGILSAYMYTSGVQKVSFQLANDSAFDVDQFVVARVGEALGRAKAAAAISGSGSSQPLGIITALGGKGAANATSTTTAIKPPTGVGGYVNLGTAALAPQAAGDSATTELIGNTLAPQTLRAMVAAVDPAYRAMGAKFYLNDAQLLGLRGLVDSNGRPLINLQDGLTPGAPSTLWGYEIVVDQNIPNLAASTVGGPVFGNLQSAMVLRTVTQSGLLRLSERYADLLQIGFIGYMRFDIRSNDLRAAVTVKPAAT